MKHEEDYKQLSELIVDFSDLHTRLDQLLDKLKKSGQLLLILQDPDRCIEQSK